MHILMDIGGSNIRIAGVDSLESRELQNRTSFHNSLDYSANINRIIETIKTIDLHPESISFCTPGGFNEDSTVIIGATFVKQYIGQPIVQTLRDHFSCPVIMNHDTETAAYGEALYSNTTTDFAFLIYGTGIGAAFVHYEDGKPYARNATDEEHKAYLRPWTDDCSGRRIEEAYGKPAAELSDAEWDRVMDKYYYHLVRFIGAFEPKKIIIGGGVAVKQWSRLQKVFAQLHKDHPELNVSVSLTTLGEDTALYGASGWLQNDETIKNTICMAHNNRASYS